VCRGRQVRDGGAYGCAAPRAYANLNPGLLKSLGVTIDTNLRFDCHARNVAKACNFHTRALRHVRSLLTDDIAQTVACSIVASKLDYCNALLSGAPAATFDKLQRAQNNLARVVCQSRGVAPTPGRCFTRYTGFRWGSGSPINWLYWLTKCEPQPLQRISASWYRPVHHLGFCALPMLRCSSFLSYTPNWPVALFLLLLRPPGTLYLLTFDCAKTLSLSNATWKPIYSNSLRPPVLHQAPLYLRT